MKDIKVKAGQPIDFKVPINGSPPPTAEWFLDDEPLEPTEDEELMTPMTNKEAQLAVKHADKKHRGNLKLVLKNDHGTFEGTCNLVVFGTFFLVLASQPFSVALMLSSVNPKDAMYW